MSAAAAAQAITMQNGRLTRPTARSSRSSKATAPAPISGGPASASSTPPSRRPTAASGRSSGRKCSPARRRSTRPATGCPTRRSTPSANYLVGIKGPLTTPVGGGIRSLNVALRQISTSTSACGRCSISGRALAVKHPELIDMVIFRENTEDIYAGIEYAGGTPESQKVLDFLAKEFPKEFGKIRFGTQGEDSTTGRSSSKHRRAARATCRSQVGIGFKPISYLGTERLVHSAIGYAIKNRRKSVTLVHKGNIMKFTEGGFRDWGYQVAKEFYGAARSTAARGGDHRRQARRSGIVIKDVIADAFLQQILTRPADYDVIATLNLNGDYISDALAACVGGIGIAPGGNINYVTGHAIFEATHGTAPKYAGQDKVNPGSRDPLRRDDAPLHGLDRSRRPDHQGPQRRDRREDGHLRLRAVDGRRHASEMQRIRRRRREAHGLAADQSFDWWSLGV